MTTNICASPLVLAAISLDMIPPEAWIALVTTALTLAVSAAHARGRRLPLIEWVLDLVHKAPAPNPPAPAPIEPGPPIQDLLTELKALRQAREKSGS